VRPSSRQDAGRTEVRSGDARRVVDGRAVGRDGGRRAGRRLLDAL